MCTRYIFAKFRSKQAVSCVFHHGLEHFPSLLNGTFLTRDFCQKSGHDFSFNVFDFSLNTDTTACISSESNSDTRRVTCAIGSAYCSHAKRSTRADTSNSLLLHSGISRSRMLQPHRPACRNAFTSAFTARDTLHALEFEIQTFRHVPVFEFSSQSSRIVRSECM